MLYYMRLLRHNTRFLSIEPEGNHLPSVTVCNFNRIKRSAAARYNLTDDLISYVFLALRGVYPITDTYDTPAYDAKFHAWRQHYGFNTTSMLKALGHNCTDALVAIASTIKCLEKRSVKKKSKRNQHTSQSTYLSTAWSTYRRQKCAEAIRAS